MNYFLFNIESLLFFIVIIVIFFSYVKTKYSYWSKQGIPTANFLLYFLPYPLQVEKLIRKHGKIIGFFEFLTPVLICSDPDVLKFILCKDFYVFKNRRKIKSSNDIAKNSLFILEDDNWKRIRSIVSPTFSSSRIKKMKYLVDNSVDELIYNFNKLTSNGKSQVNIRQAFEAFSMQVVLQVGFSTKIHCLEQSNNPVTEFTRRLFNLRIGLGVFSRIFALLYSKTFNKDILSFFKIFTLKITDERKKTDEKSKIKRNDFLQLMFDALQYNNENDSNMNNNYQQINCSKNINDKLKSNSSSSNSINKTLTKDEFVSQCLVIMLGGFDTVATTLSYVAYSLANNQCIREELYQEIRQVFSKSQDNNDIDIDTINSLKYLDAVVCETLRLYSPFPFIERTASQDYYIEKYNLKIPKDTIIHIPVHTIHTDSDYFPDPYVFKPERFLSKNRNFPQYSFIPFGAGPRQCLAIRWALLKVKLALVHIVYNFKFSLTSNTLNRPYFYYGSPLLCPKVELVNMEKRINKI